VSDTDSEADVRRLDYSTRLAPRFLYSFRLAVLWPLLVAGLVAGLVLWNRLPRVLEESAAQNLDSALAILAPTVAERVGDPPEQLHTWVREISADSETRLTIIRRDGVVVADSARTWDEVGRMDNHRSRPEVETALDRRRGRSVRLSATTGLQYIYVAQITADADGRLYVVRLAQPLVEVQALEDRLVQALLWTALLSSLAVVLVWLGLQRHLFGPLRRLTEGADRLARGNGVGRLDEPETEPLATLAAALNRLADRVAEQIDQVKSEHAHLQEILASMSDGILVTDANRRVRLMNDALRSLLGVESEGEELSLLEITRRPEVVRLVESCESEGAMVTDQSVLLEDGRVLAASASPVSAGGVLVVVRDVTDRVHLDETRRDFVANVSHEIKTPLTAIRGFAETLREGALEEPLTAAKFTERILGQCARLEVLLSDLLPLARMEAADEQGIEFVTVDLAKLARRAVEDVRREAESRNVVLEVAIDDPLPPIHGDPESLDQLVLNLLNNAVKYNRDGGIVRLTIRQTNGSLEVAVEDTGIGIPAEAIPRIFERFYRVDKGRARDEGGTGLGLALVKHAAKLHGGTVEVESQLGVGSTFRASLPIEAA
jgi:two-component system phosphate regulon sensor histidine kinase PhoR